MVLVTKTGGNKMDYSKLAVELLNKMQLLHRTNPKNNLTDALRGESFVLQYLLSHDEAVLPGEIGSEMNVSSARIAQTLNSIEKKGWITRQIDPDDRRRIIVKLMPEGKTEAEKQQQKLMDDAAKILDLLGEHDAKEYVRIMGKLAEVISKNM